MFDRTVAVENAHPSHYEATLSCNSIWVVCGRVGSIVPTECLPRGGLPYAAVHDAWPRAAQQRTMLLATSTLGRTGEHIHPNHYECLYRDAVYHTFAAERREASVQRLPEVGDSFIVRRKHAGDKTQSACKGDGLLVRSARCRREEQLSGVACSWPRTRSTAQRRTHMSQPLRNASIVKQYTGRSSRVGSSVHPRRL